MRRLSAIALVLAICAAGVAAVVRAQEAEESSRWSQRWSAFKGKLNSDDRDEPIRGQDWSADRKFGGGRSQAPRREKSVEQPVTGVPTPANAPTAAAKPQAVTQADTQAPAAVMAAAPRSPAPPAATVSAPSPTIASPTESSLATAPRSVMKSSRRTVSSPVRGMETPAATVVAPADEPSYTARANAPRSSSLAEESSVAESFETAETSEPSSASIPTLAERIAAARRSSAEANESATVIENDTLASESTSARRTAVAESAAASTLDRQPASSYVARGTSRSTTTIARTPAPAVSRAADDNVLIARKSPILAVETAGPRTITIGKEAAYTVAIHNSGDVAAQEVLVSIRVPEWADVVNARMTAGSTRPVAEAGAGEPFQWNIPRLEGNSKQELVLRLIPRKSKPFDLAVQWTFSPTSSQTLVEVQEPKLAMTMAGPDEILFGQTKVFKVSLSNPGTGDAENVVIELQPLGPGQKSTLHRLGTIGAGDSKVVEVELTARQTGNVMIRASATADGDLTADVAEEVLVRRAALQIAAQGPQMVYAGTTASYEIAVANPGNATAERVEVTGILPSGAKVISASSGAQMSSDGRTIVWTLPALQSNGQTMLTLKCQLNQAGVNAVQLRAEASGELSHDASTSTQVEALADLKLEIADPQGPVLVGDDMIYEIRIRNRGTKAAENVDVVAFFSEGLEPTSVEGAAHEILPGQVTFRPLASLSPDQEVVFKIKARASADGNHIFRAEVNCETSGARLASEECTFCYSQQTGEPASEYGRQSPVSATPAEPEMLEASQGSVDSQVE